MKGGSHYKRGLWTVEEDKILMDYISLHGKGRWNRVAKMTGLKRCGKSCRLRWVNYLSPNVKKGDFTEEEDDLIVRLHKLLGNSGLQVKIERARQSVCQSCMGVGHHNILDAIYYMSPAPLKYGWSLIAGRVPGRTDNQVKNHWNTHLSKKLGIKKGKRKLGVNMPKPSRDETRQEISADLDPKLQSCDENSGAMASSGSEISKDDFETSNSLEVVPNEFLVDSFWFSDDNLRLDHSSLMEVPDVYSLDTLWHDL